jgi:hypothetical protein
MRMKKALLYQLIFLISYSVSGQNIYVKAEYPSVVNAGEQFTIMWTVNAGGGEFTAPLFSGFYKLMGPQTSYSSSTQIINGKVSNETSYSYVYYLQGVKEGKFVIAPATFTLKNKIYSSDSLRIEVIGSTSQRQNVNPGNNDSANDQEVESSGKDLFIRLSVNRREITMGEPVVATVKIYSRVNIAGINEIKYPSFNSFLRSDIATPPLTSLRQENINGTIYGSGVIQQFLLYPQVTGEIKIDPVEISVLVQQKTKGESDPFFGDFFSSYQTIPKVAASQPVRIKVRPLPGVQPADYSGVVGKLELKATLNKQSVNVNDAVTFKVVLSGTGNLKIASAPVLKLSPDIELYDPKVTDDIKNGVNGTTGQKSFEYLMIPRHNGDYSIPPISYSYFNIANGRYEKLTTEEFHFSVQKVSGQNSGATVYGGVGKEDVKYLGKDIRFIKSDPGTLKKTDDLLFTKQSFYSAYAFSLFAFLLILFLRRENIRRNSDLSQVRNRKAGKVAIKRLQLASVCLKNDETDQFYDEILKAIWGYLSDKLNIPVSDLTRNNAISSLQEQGIDDEIIQSLSKILDACEFERFAPSSSGAEVASIYEGASNFIKSVENLIG